MSLPVNPSPVARSLLWHLYWAGRGIIVGPSRSGPLDKPGAGLITVESGHGFLELESGQWPLQRGRQFVLFSMHQRRQMLPRTGEALVVWSICFSGPGLEAWLEQLNVARHPVFTLPQTAVSRRPLQRLVKLGTSRPPHWELEVHRGIMALLEQFLVMRSELGTNTKRVPPDLTHVLSAIAADRARDWSVRELAALAGMSYSSFRAKFRSAMTQSVRAYLQRTRLDLARELLMNESLRIKDVAANLHFSSEYYFSYFFHRHTGVSPTEFRKHLAIKRPI